MLYRDNIIVTLHYFSVEAEESRYNRTTTMVQGVLDVPAGNKPQYLSHS